MFAVVLLLKILFDFIFKTLMYTLKTLTYFQNKNQY